jgi:hypothetical protein
VAVPEVDEVAVAVTAEDVTGILSRPVPVVVAAVPSSGDFVNGGKVMII